MNKPFIVSLVLVFGITSAPAAATKQVAPPPASDAKSDMVCFSEPVVGSHLKKRICMTEEQREQRMRANQEAMKKYTQGKKGNRTVSSD